jgi:hypothetical protein
LLGIHGVEYRRRHQGEEVVVNDELYVLAAGKGPPMRPGAVGEVKEGEVRNAQ